MKLFNKKDNKEKNNNNTKNNIKNVNPKDLKVENTIYGAKVPVKYSVEEKSDIFFEQNRNISRFLFKYCIATTIIVILITIATNFYLILRNDAVFYASSGDGKIQKIETRKTPEGSFVLTPYKKVEE